MNLYETISHALEQIEHIAGDLVLSWGNAQYPCVASNLKRGASLMVGGYVVTLDKSITVRRESYGTATPPNLRDVITISGTNYRIETLGDHGAFYRYGLVQINKRA